MVELEGQEVGPPFLSQYRHLSSQFRRIRLDVDGDVDRTGDLISELSLAFALAISRVFVSERDWASGASAFLANAREEAVPA